MRVLIVDDEPLARRGVAARLRRQGDLEIVGECGDGVSAVEAIQRLRPDLVFLDIRMPGMDGFEVLRSLPRAHLPAVIFLTAYDQYALQAFEVHAIDYLLKPIDDRRFAEALERVRRSQAAALTGRLLEMLDAPKESYASRFAIKLGARIQLVHADDVDWIGAAGDYAELHCGDRSYLLRETMASLEQRLDPKAFLRIHRSRIVRASRIVELKTLENHDYIVRLADGSEHRSSRTYADRLEQWLG
ncbi:MAG TPA: LytTR family DNA-binding domain-containing protein [Magnetospirillaceae bacterium]|nr:LytTR family DNA-binding domain-containing protein [Magnetospirillaceae bacterium]